MKKKNYVVILENKKYEVTETKTGYVMNRFTNKKEAETLCNQINRRGGFEGESPTFFACLPK